jgi:hypothetical protein
MDKLLALEKEQLPPQGPCGGSMEGTLLFRYIERKVRFCFIKRPCLLGNLSDMQKKALETDKSLDKIALREIEGGSFSGNFERQ